MPQPHINPAEDAALRRRAEVRMRGTQDGVGAAANPADAGRMIHELQVHQVELELQNEELREVRSQLEATLQRYSDLYDFAPNGYLTVMADGVIREVNLTAAALLGIERGSLLGGRLQHLVAPDDGRTLDTLLTTVFAEGSRQSAEVRLAQRCGSADTVSVRLTATRPPEQKDAFVVMEDVTLLRAAEKERQALEAKMWQAQKFASLGVLAGGVAHDFNNLLTAILGHASLARTMIQPGDEVGASLREIERASIRAAGICRQMLTYAGKSSPEVGAVRLPEVVDEVCGFLGISIPRKVVIERKYEAALPPVEADAAQVRQVVLNLVLNASEAIGEGCGVVTISLGSADCDDTELRGGLVEAVPPAGRYVFLEVRDTGCGMDAATQSRMFDPFFSTKFPGRGMGLAAILGIVRGHGGTLKVWSRKGEGTSVRVYFPAVDHPLPAGEPPAETAIWHGSGTILLVDDEAPVRNVAARMLRSWGFDVIAVEDGRSALAAFAERAAEIRCVLLDLGLPDLDGAQVFGELRRQAPAVRVILASGYSESSVVRELLGMGLDGFVEKPFSVQRLNAMLKRVLGE